MNEAFLDFLQLEQGHMKAGQLVIQLRWIDEPGIWKDYAPLNPAISSAYQLNALAASAQETVERYGDEKYRPILRVGTCLRDFGWNGVATKSFNPHGVELEAVDD